MANQTSPSQRSRVRPPQPRVVRASYADYGGIPFGQGLGPAGEQFLEQTPWANPNHPAHGPPVAQRPHIQDVSKAPAATSTPAPKRKAQKAVPMSAGTISNASNHSPVVATTPSQAKPQAAKTAPRSISTSPEVARAASLLEQTSARSMREMNASSRPITAQAEPLPPVGGRS